MPPARRGSIARIAFGAFCAPLLMSQTLITGDITGTVTDPSGAVIPRAAVSLKNNGTGAGRETVANGQGSYRFSLLSPGNYLLTAKAPDFSPGQKNVQVRVGQISAVDL